MAVIEKHLKLSLTFSSIILSTVIHLMPEGKCYASDTSIPSQMEIRLHKLTPQVMICTRSLPASHNQALISLGKSTKDKDVP